MFRLRVVNPILILMLLSSCNSGLVSRLGTQTFSHQHTYIPLMYANVVLTGVEVWPGMVPGVTQHLEILKPKIIKTYLDWSEIENTRGVYNWSASFDTDYQLITQTQSLLFVTFKNTPPWARTGSLACSRIQPQYSVDFANFIVASIMRYPAIRYVEVWNEPDVLDTEITPDIDGYFGCWANQDQPFYGGDYYAHILATVYPLVQPLGRVVVAGSLAFLKPAVAQSWADGWISKGNYDLVSLHAYMRSERELRNALDFLTARSLTRIIISETSWLCYSPEPCGLTEQMQQSRWLTIINDNAHRYDLVGWVWYTLPPPGWRDAGLLNMFGQVKTVYNTFKGIDSVSIDTIQGNPYP